MSYTLRTSDINSLVYQYFIERGLSHSAFLLKNEAGHLVTDLQPGSLVSYLEKSLAMEELQYHRNEDVFTIQEYVFAGGSKCLNEFRLNHAHECAYDEANKTIKTNGVADELQPFLLLSGHSSQVTRLGSWKGVLISGGNDGTIRLWRFCQEDQSYQHIRILPHIDVQQRPSPVMQFDYNQFGSIVSLASDSIVRIWSFEGSLSNTIQASSNIISVEWDTSGSFILTTTSSTLDLWNDQGTLQQSWSHPSIQSITQATCRSPTEFTVQTRSDIWAWRQNEKPLNILQGETTNMKWSPSKTFLVIQVKNNIAVYQDEYDNWWLGRDNTVFEFAGKGNVVASGNSLGEVLLWDLERRNILGKVSASVGKIEKIVFRKDDEFLAVKGEEDVQVCCLGDLGTVRKIKGRSRVQDMIWTDEGNKVILSTLDKIAVYNLKMS